MALKGQGKSCFLTRFSEVVTTTLLWKRSFLYSSLLSERTHISASCAKVQLGCSCENTSTCLQRTWHTSKTMKKKLILVMFYSSELHREFKDTGGRKRNSLTWKEISKYVFDSLPEKMSIKRSQNWGTSGAAGAAEGCKKNIFTSQFYCFLNARVQCMTRLNTPNASSTLFFLDAARLLINTAILKKDTTCTHVGNLKKLIFINHLKVFDHLISHALHECDMGASLTLTLAECPYHILSEMPVTPLTWKS